MDKLKPCPFCGGENLQSGSNWSSGDGYVHCYSCGGHMTTDGYYETREQEAIHRWNMRSANETPNADVTVLAPEHWEQK